MWPCTDTAATIPHGGAAGPRGGAAALHGARVGTQGASAVPSAPPLQPKRLCRPGFRVISGPLPSGFHSRRNAAVKSPTYSVPTMGRNGTRSIGPSHRPAAHWPPPRSATRAQRTSREGNRHVCHQPVHAHHVDRPLPHRRPRALGPRRRAQGRALPLGRPHPHALRPDTALVRFQPLREQTAL